MTVHYPDVSNWNPGFDATPYPVLVAKATQGTSYVDHLYTNFQAQAAGKPFCAYHWLDTTPAVDQARHCFSVVGPHVPLMIDDEQNVIVVQHTLDFVAEYRRLGGTVTLEYAPHWVWQNSGSPDLRPLAAAGLSLVSSNYTTYSDTGPGWNPYGGVTPAIWQYTSSPVDMNAFKGTIDQLAALFTGGTAPTPEEDDDMHMIGSGAEDGSIYLAPGYAAPSGRIAAYGLSADLFASYQAAEVKAITLPHGMTVAACPLYDIDPQPWPAGALDQAGVEAAAEKGAKAGIDGATIHTAG